MVSVFAEFERNIIRDRVISGMDRAKKFGTKSGKRIGRPSNVNGSTEAAVIEKTPEEEAVPVTKKDEDIS